MYRLFIEKALISCCQIVILFVAVPFQLLVEVVTFFQQSTFFSHDFDLCLQYMSQPVVRFVYRTTYLCEL